MKTFGVLLAVLLISLPVLAQQRLDKSRYVIVMDEEFEYSDIHDTAMKIRWQYEPYHAYWSGGIELYDESQLSIQNNEEGNKILRIHAQRIDTPQLYGAKLKRFKSGYICYKQVHEPTCERLSWSSDPWPGFTYGMFEIRCKIPSGSKRSWDAWPAFWLTSFPIAEIDMFDQISNDPGGRLNYGMINWSRYPDYNSADWERAAVLPGEEAGKPIGYEDFSGDKSYKTGDAVKFGNALYKAKRDIVRSSYAGSNTHLYADLSLDYHVYTAVWTPRHLSFFLDGTEVATWKFDQHLNAYDCPMRIIANLAVIGKHDGMPSDFTADNMYYDIDYIKVYKPANGDYEKSPYMWLPPYVLPIDTSEY